jgi:hypothetical protein
MRALLAQHHEVDEQGHHDGGDEESPKPERGDGLHAMFLQTKTMTGHQAGGPASKWVSKGLAGTTGSDADRLRGPAMHRTAY